MHRTLSLLGLLGLSLWTTVPACSDGSPPASAVVAGMGGAAGAAGVGSAGSPSQGGQAGASAGSAGKAGKGGASAGAAGKGGAAGSAGGAGAALDPWIVDESAWEPFSIEGTYFKDCTLSHARPEHLPQGPQFEWTSCGDGCEQLDPTWLGQFANFTALSVVQEDGEAHPLMASSWGAPPYAVRRLIDLSTGKIRNALRGVSTKGVYPVYCTGGRVNEARMYELAPYPDGSDEQARYALWMKTDGSLGQSSIRPVIKSGVDYFFNDTSGFIGGGGVRRFGVVEPSTEWIDQENFYKAGAARGNLAAWLVYGDKTNQQLRVWTPDGTGAHTLLNIPINAEESGLNFYLAASPTRIVGRFAKPKPGDSSTKIGVRLWHTQNTTKPEEATLTVSPPLPMPPDLPELLVGGHATWGDYVTQQLSTILSVVHMRVIHLPTWTVYTLYPDPGFSLPDARSFTISDKHVYFAMRDKNIGSYDASVIRRYELSKLSKTAARVQMP